MWKYRYINFQDRKQLSALYRTGERPADIAQKLGVTTSAIYRELKRGETLNDGGSALLDHNQRRVYNPVLAQQHGNQFLKNGNIFGVKIMSFID